MVVEVVYCYICVCVNEGVDIRFVYVIGIFCDDDRFVNEFVGVYR